MTILWPNKNKKEASGWSTLELNSWCSDSNLLLLNAETYVFAVYSKIRLEVLKRFLQCICFNNSLKSSPKAYWEKSWILIRIQKLNISWSCFELIRIFPWKTFKCHLMLSLTRFMWMRNLSLTKSIFFQS